MAKAPVVPPDHPAGFVFNPKLWGPSFWNVIHAVAYLYPVKDPLPQQRALVRNFYAMVPFVLPCSLCGMHWMQHLKEHPLTDEVLSSRETLSRWTVDMHNAANASLKKEAVSYDQAYRYYVVDADADRVLPKDAAWIAAVVVLSLAVVGLLAALLAVLGRRR